MPLAPVPLPRRFQGRSVVVTGAGTGFGAEIAVRAAQEGARAVGVHYRSSVEGAKRTADRVAAEGSTPVLLQADIVNWEQITAMADAAFERLDGVNVLVNNVGDVAREQMSWRDITAESIDHVLAVNIKGTLLCVHEFGSRMLDQGHGAIINIGSTVIVRGSARAPQYAAAKYGILGLTKSYAHAFAPTVRVNVFAPGFIETEATLGRRDWQSGRGDQLRSLTPMGRIPGPGRAGGHGSLPRDRRRLAHDRRVHGRGRRLQHGRSVNGPHPRDLGLAEARALVQRAVNKAEQLGLRGAIAVVGATGTLLTASRMDAGGPGGMARARSKAWISATQQIPSAEHLHRMTTIAPPVAAGFALASPEALFPGAGGMPVSVDGVVVAGLAASGATVSPFFPADADPRVLSADGRPANPEDLLIAYALGLPYAGQHGDDQKRWEERFGDLVIDPAESLGLAPAPRATRQAQLGWAKGLCDAVMATASDRGVHVAVSVVDGGGDPIQQDLMDGGPAGAVAVAQAVASAAALFDCDSGDLKSRFGAADAVATLVVPPVLGVPGGLPVRDAGRVVAGLGVGGGDPAVCEKIARTALAAA